MLVDTFSGFRTFMLVERSPHKSTFAFQTRQFGVTKTIQYKPDGYKQKRFRLKRTKN